MTSVLIIGSSHAGAYKNAAPRFAALYPEVTLSFFGVRGPLFLGGRIEEDGRFTVPLRDDRDRSFVTETNGQTSVATGGHDHLLMVGHRFAFGQIAALLQDHDLLEGARSGKPHLLGETLLHEAIDAAVAAEVEEAAAAIAAFGGQVTFAMAPAPATTIVDRCGTLELADVMQAFWSHPDAPRVHDIWRASLRAALAARSHGLLEQPDALNDGPYATAARYASEAAALNDGTLGRKDHRHMNADYGLAMLRAFAETRLGLSRKETRSPALTET